ncbi:MAG: sigma-E factor negative regulatory protein [Burkholderiales bacterium]
MEKLSELMDGELDEHALETELLRLKNDPELREAWDVFHLIGDTLRGQAQLSARYVERVNSRLAVEPTVLAPRRRNIGRLFRRAALPIAASACGVAVVAWLALYTSPIVDTTTTMAAQSPPAALQQPAAQLAALPENNTMNEYLLAHQQFSPSTALGMVSYVRTVSARDDNR